MYSVSEKYIAALKEPVQHRKLRGTVKVGRSTYSFDESNILSGSFSINNQCVNGSDIKLGSVNIGALKCTFMNMNVTRGNWQKAEISFDIGLRLDTGAYEWVPCGVYEVSEANHNSVGVAITAYDRMSKFDKALGENVLSGYAYDILNVICTEVGVTNGMTRASFAQFPNGNALLGNYVPNNLKTYRDMLSALAQAVGGFATMDRSGAVVIRKLSNDSVISFEPDERMSGGIWSDFKTRYTGLSVVNMKDETTKYYHKTPDDGSVMNLGANPFLQLGVPQEVDRMRKALLNEIDYFRYVPCTVNLPGDIAFDLGDVISFPNGIADNSASCVMQYNYTFNKSYQMKSFGEDPATVGAQSKTDKEISGLGQQSKANAEVYYSWVSTQEIFFPDGDEDVVVANLMFTANSSTMADIWHEFKLETEKAVGSDRITATVHYFYDGVLLEYQPIETWAIDGYHILQTHYLTGVEPGSVHSWTVKLTIDGGTANLSPMNGHIVLHGQGLGSNNEWDGILSIDEEMALRYGGHLDTSLLDQADISMQTPIGSLINESYSLKYGGQLSIGFEDRSYLALREGIYPLVTEDGKSLITEDGKPLETEGGQ